MGSHDKGERYRAVVEGRAPRRCESCGKPDWSVVSRCVVCNRHSCDECQREWDRIGVACCEDVEDFTQ